MPSILATLLWPLRWLIESVLVGIHQLLTGSGVPLDSGTVWLISIIALLAIVKSAALPLIVLASKNNQQLGVMNYDIGLLNKQYKLNKNDVTKRLRDEAVRQVKASSTAAMWKTLLPVLVQLPVFLALYTVLRSSEQGIPGVGAMTSALAKSLQGSTLLGVPLQGSLTSNHGGTVVVIAIALTLAVAVCQFASQLLSYKYNVTDQARQSRASRVRLVMVFAAPPVLILTSLAIPLTLLVYLTASNLWSLLQQNLVMYRYPLPFTEADRVLRMQTTVQQHPLRPDTKRSDPPGDEHVPHA